MYGSGVINPAINIIGIAHQVNIAPPVKSTSTMFIAASMEIIETNDMPIAVWKASFNFICLERIKVSSMIEVIKPLIMAKIIMFKTDQDHGFCVIWKK